MSEKKSPPRKEKASSSTLLASCSSSSVKTPQSTSKTESATSKILKRKLFSPSSGSAADEEEKKVSIPKRRRSSLHAEAIVTGSPPPVTSSSCSGLPLPPGSSASKTPGRQAPLSERQQIAKIMQQYAAEETHGDLSPRHPSSSPPHSTGKRTPFDKKMNKKNEKGETMLHVAAIRGDLKQTKKLIKAGADVNVKDHAGWTPLHEACNHGFFNVAKQLLKNGANVNVLGLENDTPLHDASVNGHVKLIQLLLRHGANPLQINMAGKAPIDVARDDSILKLLKSETIASSSGSESVTSEVRSPTSPESNLSEDDHEDEGKRRKDNTENLFMPRSANMISSIGASAASSSSHSPTSTTATPTKPPIIDPYAYHEETDTDLPSHTPSSSTTPSRTSAVFKNIQVSHKMSDSQGPRLKMVFTHNKARQEQRGGGLVHSPKRGAGSQMHHDEPKKQKLFGGGLYGDKHIGGSSDKPNKSKYTFLDAHVGSSSRAISPADSASSQDSDLYDPKLGGSISHRKNAELLSQAAGSSHSKVSSSDNISSVYPGDNNSKSHKNEASSSKHYKSKDNEAAAKHLKRDFEGNQKHSSKKDSEAVPKHQKKEADTVSKSLKKEFDLFAKQAKKDIVETSFQPDSQMPVLSQDGFSPVQFDINFDDVSDSDDNRLQIDVDSTTTPTKPSTLSTNPLVSERSNSSKNIPSSSSTSKFHGSTSSLALKSDVSSTISTTESSTKTSSTSRVSPQSTTRSASPYHFSDSPCSLSSFSYKQHALSDKKHDAANSSSSSSLPSISGGYSKSEKVVDKYGSKSKADKSKQRESHHHHMESSSSRQFGVVSQSDNVSRKDNNSDNSQKQNFSSIGGNTSKSVSSSSSKSNTGSKSGASISKSVTSSSTGGAKSVTSSVSGTKSVTSSNSGNNNSKSVTSTGKSSQQSSRVSAFSSKSSASLNISESKSSLVSGSKPESHSSQKVHSPKVDTTTDVKVNIKTEIKDEPGISSSDISLDIQPKFSVASSSSSVKDEKIDLKPLSIKVEKEKAIKLERDGERSKSPKGIDREASSRKNSPKLLESSSNRSSPRPFSFKDTSTCPPNGNGNKNGSGSGMAPKWDTNRASPKSDRDSPKSDRSDRSDGSSSTPKVPPLKIIIPTKATATADSTRQQAKTHHQRHHDQQKTASLPYVLNPTQENADSSIMAATTTTTTIAPSTNPNEPVPTGLVKSSRNSSRASSVASGEQDHPFSDKNSALGGNGGGGGGSSDGDKDSNQGGGSGGVSSTQEPTQSSARRNTRSKNTDSRDPPRNIDESSLDSKPDTRSELGGDQPQKGEPSERRVTRSQMRQQGKEKKGGNNSEKGDTNGSTKDDKEERDKDSLSQTADIKDTASSSNSTKAAAQSSSSASNNNHDEIAVHPRKRKALRQRHNQEQSTAVDSSFNFFPKNNTSEKTANPYEMYLDIRKKVNKRRTEMTVVTPKAPTGFSNYLMVSCNYVLQGTAPSKLNIPMLQPPTNLPDNMKELFVEQERARYKLRLQHLIEKEKLRLSIEQEVLRVHGRAARALANQTTPLSMCAILKDEEIYNMIDPEAEEKEKGARSRYNGRQFLSWLQDVDDKYEKIKESLLLRHHHEAESLHAVQKLEWEWKLKENTFCENRSAPANEDLHVPMVIVNDEFELLPS